jgi:protein disulfide-isomerase-like protein|tara:strand:- start:114 stop:785 length:672 start_codon:yes stop_codon:yes gene_type:complete
MAMLSIIFLTYLITFTSAQDGGYTSTVVLDDIVFKTENSVAIINATVFDAAVSTPTRPWLISFTAPWCGHCKSLAPKFAAAARELESVVFVGKVDATAEQALMARFPVAGYPTIFFINKGSVYKYTGTRSTAAIVEYSRAGYKQAQPLGQTESPLGYVGVVKGKVISLGFLVQRLYRYLTDGNHVGLSVTSAVAVLAVGGLVCTMLLGIFLAWLFMPSNDYLN